MRSWPKKPLADAYWFQEGPGVRKWQFRNSGIKLLNVANITKKGVLDLSRTDRHLSEEEVSEKYSHFLADVGDLVIASSGISFDDDGLLRTRGAFVEPQHLPLCLNTSTIRFKAKEGISSLALLRYWLESKEFREQITRLVTGSAQQNFGPSHLKATTISLPPLAEQERIVKLLDEADELRKLRVQADRRTAVLLPALFHEMFGDVDSNSKKWPVVCFAELGESRLGKMLDAKQQTGNHDRPYLRNANVQWDRLELADILEMDFTAADREEFRLRYGDLLICEGGRVGRAAIWRDELPECYFQKALHRVRSYPSKAVPEFLLYALQTIEKANGFRDYVGSATIPHLTGVKLASIRIQLPPLLLQNEFAQRVTEIRELQSTQVASRRRLEDLFQSLLHRAFNGEL